MLQGARGCILSRFSSAAHHGSGHRGASFTAGLTSLHQATSQRSGPVAHLRQSVFRDQARPVTTIVTPSPDSKKWPRRFRNLLYILLFGYLGSTSASVAMKFFAGPIVEPDSPEDIKINTALNAEIDGLEFVKKLREDPDYIEWEAYGNLTEDEKRTRLTSGCLRGSRGISCQHIFYNSKENIIKSVLFVGNGVVGWPTVVHGGAIAAIFDENMGRLALENLPERTGVTANLDIAYKAPLGPGQYISVEAKYSQTLSSERKAVVEAVIRDQLGMVCSEATALFVYPKKLKLETIGKRF
ncbi:hypothetical protein FQN49_000515 [Arthroderma sp. PD_2]|nr:hypothetical protein FQN49_000515 [Arthroderma sp. PD_2]